MIDAVSGAIYVIGGSGSTGYDDVWASTDGGARAGLGQGYYGGTKRTAWVLQGHCREYSGVLQGVLRGH